VHVGVLASRTECRDAAAFEGLYLSKCDNELLKVFGSSIKLIFCF